MFQKLNNLYQKSKGLPKEEHLVDPSLTASFAAFAYQTAKNQVDHNQTLNDRQSLENPPPPFESIGYSVFVESKTERLEIFAEIK